MGAEEGPATAVPAVLTAQQTRAVVGVATWERRPGVSRTALPLRGLGAVVAAYHSWVQVAGTSSGCSLSAVSCASVQYRVLGLSMPNFSLIPCLLITGLFGVLVRRDPA